MDNPTYEDYVQNHSNNILIINSFLLDLPIGCGSELKAKLFFFSFTIMMSTVFMKLFIALIW